MIIIAFKTSMVSVLEFYHFFYLLVSTFFPTMGMIDILRHGIMEHGTGKTSSHGTL